MKKLLCLVLVIACMQVAHAQDKPRLLKYTTPLCPIDISKTFAKEGLLMANKETVSITKDTIYKEISQDIKDKEGETVLKKGTKMPEEKYDTVLLRTLLIEPGFAFDIIQQIGNYSLIKFWPLKDQKNKGLFHHYLSGKESGEQLDKLGSDSGNFAVEGLKIVTSKPNGKGDSVLYDLSKSTFIVPTALILNNSIEFENKNGALNVGLLALPVKIRPFATESGQFDFADGFSVGTTLSWTLHHNFKTGFTHNLLLYVGISSFTADSSKIKEQRNDYKIAAFSPAIGWMWGKNNVQLSVLGGMDFPAGNLQKKWVYRNMPWFGLGIGIGLFKIGNEETTKQGKN
jgi:hypothetical protein